MEPAHCFPHHPSAGRVTLPSPAENDLVCGEYILRLRLVEWVQQRTARREDVVLLG